MRGNFSNEGLEAYPESGVDAARDQPVPSYRNRGHTPSANSALYFSDRLRVGWLNGVVGRGTARAEDAQGTPTQSHISPSILVYED